MGQTHELSSTARLISHCQLGGKDFAQMIIDQTDPMIEQSTTPNVAPLLMATALHPDSVGQRILPGTPLPRAAAHRVGERPRAGMNDHARCELEPCGAGRLLVGAKLVAEFAIRDGLRR